MCRETEQQKIKTQFQFREELHAEPQAREFEHPIMDPQLLQEEVKAARDSKEGIRLIRMQLSGKEVPVVKAWQAIQQTAQPQVEEPQPAPQESSWKERRTRKKQKEKERARGLKLTKHADELTARLVEQRQQYAAIQPPDDPTELLRSMQSVTVSAEMFTDENFVERYAFLRDTLHKASYIVLAAENGQMMEELRAQDPGLYATMLRWQQTEPLLRKMFRCASNAHGLNESGDVLEESELVRAEEQDGVEVLDLNVVEHARAGFGEALDEFRDTMAEQEQSRQQMLSAELEKSYEEELKQLKLGALLNSDENERQWVESPSALYGSVESIQKIQGLKTLIEEHGERYLAHKEMVDQMYSDIIRRSEALGELRVQVMAWKEVQSRYSIYQNEKQSDGGKLWRMMNDKIDELTRDSEAVADNLTSISNAMTQFLQSGTGGLEELAVLTNYGYDTLPVQVSARARREEWQNAALNELIERGEFQPEDRYSPYVTCAPLLFHRGDDEYNLRVLQTLQNHTREMHRERPVRAPGMKDDELRELRRADVEARSVYYNELRRIVVPQAEQILAWDMDRFLQMNDAELAASQAELDELSSASAFLSELMKISYPKQEKIQMKDDVLADRMDEFDHKVAILRGLTNKSRGLAIQAMMDLKLPVEDCLTKQEREIELPAFAEEMRYYTVNDETLRTYARDQIGIGKLVMEDEQKRWKARRTMDSKAFQKACTELYNRKGFNDKLPEREYPLTEAAHRYERHFYEIQPDASQEEIDAVRRLQGEQYRIACWDALDVRIYDREHGNAPSLFKDPTIGTTIGEAIFRSFNAHIVSPGAQTQTPEEFHQMVRDLSAGVDLVQDVSSEREIFEAREQNMRGCLQFKENLRLSYDYMSRKYGFGLEKLSALEIYDHYEEILRDFSNLQVDYNFINNIPGIIDMENEEDKLLYNQIGYMSVVGAFVRNAMLSVSTERSEAERLELLRAGAVEGEAGPDRKALLRMGAASNMAETVTWGDTIRVGQRRALPEEDPQAKEARWQRFRGRRAAREREQQEIALQEAWRERNVPYPNEHTEQLYQMRERENKVIAEKARVVREVIEENIPEKKRPGKQVERAITFMLPSFELNGEGKLWGEDEAEIRRLATNYFCGKRQERNAVVNGIVNDLCETEFSTDMFYPEYVRDHFVEVKQLERRLNVMRFLEQDNKAFFKALPYETHDLWDRMRDLFTFLSEWVIATLEISGLGNTAGNEVFEPPITEEERLEVRQAQEADIHDYVQQWQRARLDYLRMQGRDE